MPKKNAEIAPVAWQLARERIGLELRKRYGTSEQLPSRLIAMLEEWGHKSEALAANRFVSPGTPAE